MCYFSGQLIHSHNFLSHLIKLQTSPANETLNTYAFPGLPREEDLGYSFAFESRRAEVMGATADELAIQDDTLSSTRARTCIAILILWYVLRKYRRLSSLLAAAVGCLVSVAYLSPIFAT